MSTLAVLIESATGRQHPLSGDGPHLVGRTAAAAVPVTDPDCSRKHFTITYEWGRFIITPTSPRNPTFLDGQRLLVPAVLQHGATVVAGKTYFQFWCPETTKEFEKPPLLGVPVAISIGSFAAIAVTVAGVLLQKGPALPTSHALTAPVIAVTKAAGPPERKPAVVATAPPPPSPTQGPIALAAATPPGPPQPVESTITTPTFRADLRSIAADLQRIEGELIRLKEAPKSAPTPLPADAVNAGKRVASLIAVECDRAAFPGSASVQAKLAFPTRYARTAADAQWAVRQRVDRRSFSEQLKAKRAELKKKRDDLGAKLMEPTSPVNSREKADAAEQLSRLPYWSDTDEAIARQCAIPMPAQGDRGQTDTKLGELRLSIGRHVQRQAATETVALDPIIFSQSISAIELEREAVTCSPTSVSIPGVFGRVLNPNLPTSAVTVKGQLMVGEAAPIEFEQRLTRLASLAFVVTANRGDMRNFATAMETYLALATTPLNSASGQQTREAMAISLRNHEAVLQQDIAAGRQAVTDNFGRQNGTIKLTELDREWPGESSAVELADDGTAAASLRGGCQLMWVSPDGKNGLVTLTRSEPCKSMPVGQLANLKVGLPVGNGVVFVFDVTPNTLETKSSRTYALAMRGMTDVNYLLAVEVAERKMLQRQVTNLLSRLDTPR